MKLTRFLKNIPNLIKVMTDATDFKVILYSNLHADYLYQCSMSRLPLLGELIEIEQDSTFFLISNTSMLPMDDVGVIVYLVYGDIISIGKKVFDFDVLRLRMLQKPIDIEINSYGTIIFPESLNQ